MKNLQAKFGSMVSAAVLAAMTMVQGLPAQAPPPDKIASIHGHVNNAIGQPITSGEVRLTTDRSTGTSTHNWAYTFPLDKDGNYKGGDIKLATYLAVVFQGTVSADYQDKVVFTAGEDKTVNFDMTRKEYLDKMGPEERAALEDLKKKNADAMVANSKIANLNTLLQQARADIKAANFDTAIKAMSDATAAKPDEPILWETLGDAQLGQADALAKAAKASHATDASLPQKYDAATASYQKVLTLNEASAKPNQLMVATADNQLGQAYGKEGKIKEAADAYEAAAKADPTKAGMFYFNEAATALNANDNDTAFAAADKAITADPTKADAYYIKGQALITKASVDPKTNKITVPPGCVDAYQKYLELAPTGSHAEDVKGILTGIGEPIKSSYKATGKK